MAQLQRLFASNSKEDLQRLQQLERSLFTQAKIQDGGQPILLLPPINNAHDTAGRSVEQAGRLTPHGQSLQDSFNAGQSPQANAKSDRVRYKSKRGSAQNPYEAILHASPANRHIPRGMKGKLELLQPAGLDTDLTYSLQSQLQHYIASHASCRSVGSNSPRGPAMHLLQHTFAAAAADTTIQGCGFDNDQRPVSGMSHMISSLKSQADGAGYVATPAGLGTNLASNQAAMLGTALPHIGNEADRGITLGQLFSEQQTTRRRAQLMAEWLEKEVSQLWQDCEATITDLSMRSAMMDSTDVDQETNRAPGAKKGSLAAQFAAFISRSLLSQGSVGGSAWATSHQLWQHLLQVVGVGASGLVQHIASSCWEEGALLAWLWNLHTQLLDSGMAAAQARASTLEAEADDLRDQVRRLSPLLDWERSACESLAAMKQELDSTAASLALAAAERDALLRENDKIILHARKELRKQRRESRKAAWKLVKKLKNTEEQLALTQRDREQLLVTVSYTKGQAHTIVNMVHGVNNHFSQLQGASAQELQDGLKNMPGLAAIEVGLRDMVSTVSKMHAANRDAEEAHFTTEEAMTAVMALDDEAADDLINAVLAGGDPDQAQSEPYPQSSAARLGALEQLKATSAAKSFRKPVVTLTPEEDDSETESDDELMSPESKAALDWVNGDRHPPPPGEESSDQRSPGMESVGKMKAKPRRQPVVKTITPAEAVLLSSEPEQQPQPSNEANAQEQTQLLGCDVETQTEEHGLPANATQPQTNDEGTQFTPRLNPDGSVHSGGETARSGGSGARASETDSVIMSAVSPRSAARLQDLVVELQDRVEALQDELASKTKELQNIMHRADQMLNEGDAKTQEIRALEQQLETMRGMYGRLRAKIQEVGLNPDDLKVPELPPLAPPAGLLQKPHTTATALSPPSSPDGRHSGGAAAYGARNVEVQGVQVSDSDEGTRNHKGGKKSSKGKKAAKNSKQHKGKKGGGDKNKSETGHETTVFTSAGNSHAGNNQGTSSTANDTSISSKMTGKTQVGNVAAGATVASDNARVPAANAAPRTTVAAAMASAGIPAKVPTGLPAHIQLQQGRVSPAPRGSNAGSDYYGPSRPAGDLAMGRQRVVEKKIEQAATERLADSIQKFSGIRSRTLDWLLKLIDGMYKGKMTSDEMRARMTPPLEPMPLVDYMYQHLAGIYGTRDLVNQYSAQLVATIKQFIQVDRRVALFNQLLTEVWPSVALSVFLDGLRRVTEAARLPCCDFPADWSPNAAGGAGGRRGGGVPMVDVRKCLWVADKVLFRRHSKTSYSFAASLAVKGEPVTEQELQQFFVAPGYYGTDVTQMREFERGRAEFRKVQITVFLESLIEEYLRCEAVYQEVLPGIFKKWDQDGDALLMQQDVQSLFDHISTQGISMDAVGQEANKFWNNALTIENENLPSGSDKQGTMIGAVVQPALQQESSAGGVARYMIGVNAFMRAAQKCDAIRAYVRLHKTPPAKLRIQNSDEDQAKILLFLLIRRHWQLHGPALLKLFKDSPQAAQMALLTQCDSVEKESDGSRKAMALHGLLKMMIGSKLDRLVIQLSPDNLAQSVDPDFEVSLTRLTQAVKVLYGANVIIADELLDNPDASSMSPVAQMHKQKQIAQVCMLYNTIRSRISHYALGFLSNHRNLPYWVQRWKARSQQRAASRQQQFLAQDRLSFLNSTLSPDINSMKPSQILGQASDAAAVPKLKLNNAAGI